MMKTHNLFICISIVLHILIGFGNHDDYQIILTHSAINQLSQHIIPVMTEEMLSLTIEPQTIDMTVTIEIGEITVKNFSIHNITVDLDPNTQLITMNAINLNLELNTFQLKVLICRADLSPEFINWNFSLSFNTSTNNCSIYIDLVDSATVIQEGTLNFNKNWESDFCRITYNAAEWLANVEEKIKDEIVDQIPKLMNDELQTAINGFVQNEASNVNDIKICYKNITIYNEHLLIAGDLITPNLTNLQLPLPSNMSTTPVIIEDSDDEPIYDDDASFFIFFIIILILSCMIGCGVGIGIFCGCNNKKFKALREIKDTDDYVKPTKLNSVEIVTEDEDDGMDTNIRC